MKRKTLTVLAAFAIVTGLGLAQNATDDTNLTDPGMQGTATGVNTVMIASSESHTDATVADVASDRAGAPVLLTEPDSLPESTAQALEEQNVENAVIVGGEAAISPEVEEEINSIVGQTERIAGETASDTSLEVANFFWPQGTSEAVVVQAPLMDDRESTYRLASTAANTAGGNPLILADTDTDIASALQEQGINQATVYSLSDHTGNMTGENMTGNQTDNMTETLGETPNATTENETPENLTPEATPEIPEAPTPEAPAQEEEANLTQSLEEAGITAEVNTGSVEELTSNLYSQIQDNPDNRQMYAVTGTDFQYGIPTYAHPNAATYIVTDETLEEDVQYLTDSGYDTVTVIGEQNLGQQITANWKTQSTYR